MFAKRWNSFLQIWVEDKSIETTPGQSIYIIPTDKLKTDAQKYGEAALGVPWGADTQSNYKDFYGGCNLIKDFCKKETCLGCEAIKTQQYQPSSPMS